MSGTEFAARFQRFVPGRLGAMMKVYELIAKLQKAPAGADVVVGMCATLNADLESCAIEDNGSECGQVVLTGGDAQLVSDDGDEKGYLSELAAADE